MRKSLLVLSFSLMGSLSVFGQKPVYQIAKTGKKYSNVQIESAFNNANFCGLINPDEDYRIYFDDGTVVIIFSSVLAKGFDPSCVREQNQNEIDAIWTIKEGILIKPMTATYNKKS